LQLRGGTEKGSGREALCASLGSRVTCTVHSGVLDLYRHWQALLGEFGNTGNTRNLQHLLEQVLVSELQLDPFDGGELNAALAEVHLEAFPNPQQRPMRLTSGDGMLDPKE
jgi:hypothetical protein